MTAAPAAWPPTARFALYAAPPAGSALAELGRAWLGRDAESGARVTAPPLTDLSPARWHELVAAPRHYGFHGTLKAPFELAEGRTAADLCEALAAFAAGRAPVTLGGLQATRVAGFLALVPVVPCRPLDDLAAACVEAFDRFRRPEAPDVVAKRRAAGLTARQSALLERWGYPYVFDEFRFHMTLTGPVAPDESAWLLDALRPLLAPASRPQRMADICLFAQPDRGAPFRLVRRYPFARG